MSDNVLENITEFQSELSENNLISGSMHANETEAFKSEYIQENNQSDTNEIFIEEIQFDVPLICNESNHSEIILNDLPTDDLNQVFFTNEGLAKKKSKFYCSIQNNSEYPIPEVSQEYIDDHSSSILVNDSTHSVDKISCIQFADPVLFAKDFIEHIIDESEDYCGSIPFQKISSESLTDQYSPQFYGNDFQLKPENSFTSWPKIEDFNIKLGATKIDEYLSSFDTHDDWMYVVYYQEMNKIHFTELYKYEVIYSLPTPKYPIAQATASMYFTIAVCKAKPPHCLVDVTFTYETFRQIHKPGLLDFKEKWLHYILDSKIKIFPTLTY